MSINTQACHLNTGWNCKRLCHLCTSQERFSGFLPSQILKGLLLIYVNLSAHYVHVYVYVCIYACLTYMICRCWIPTLLSRVHIVTAPCRRTGHNPRSGARWRLDGPGPLPFKPTLPNSSVLSIAGTGAPKYVLLDYCHAFHLGYGQDLGASAIVVLALLSYFGTDRSLDSRLGNAFSRYTSWLKRSKKTSSLHDFSKKTFGMGSKLG